MKMFTWLDGRLFQLLFSYFIELPGTQELPEMPVTPDASSVGKSTTDGKDFYFFVLKKDAASQLFDAFGEDNRGAGCDHVDGGTSRFDQNGVIYEAICANCKELDAYPYSHNSWCVVNQQPIKFWWEM